MATYHICDLCGKDLKNKAPYHISISPNLAIRGLCASTNDIRFKEKLINDKEVCEECATAYSRSLEEAEKQRDNHNKVIAIGVPNYETVLPEVNNAIVIDNGVSFCLGDYHND